jgi:hypothetical protein
MYPKIESLADIWDKDSASTSTDSDTTDSFALSYPAGRMWRSRILPPENTALPHTRWSARPRPVPSDPGLEIWGDADEVMTIDLEA